MSKKNNRKLNIFVILDYLDHQDMGVYEEIKNSNDDELISEFNKNIGWMIQCWMTGAFSENDHEKMIRNFHKIANVGWYSIKDHPELQTKLLACCGIGKSVKHKFYKPGLKRKYNNLFSSLKKIHPDLDHKGMILWCKINDESALNDLGYQIGLQKSDLPPLVKEFRECQAMK